MIGYILVTAVLVFIIMSLVLNKSNKPSGSSTGGQTPSDKDPIVK